LTALPGEFRPQGVDSDSNHTPVLFIAGRYDRVRPSYAQVSFDAFGSDPAAKQLRIFESSGHQPFFDDPEQFVTAVTSFVDGL